MAPARTLALRLGVVALIAAVVVACSTLLGPRRDTALSVFFPPSADIFWQFRAPRTLLAAVAGAGLALGGVVFQTLFRNPLATPYTLGIASGASLAAAVGFLYEVKDYWLGMPRLGLLAFAGALAAMAAIVALARLQSGRDMTRLLLAGVCIMFLCNAGIMLATFFRAAVFTNDIVVWLMGSLAVHRPRAVIEIAVVLAPVLLLCVGLHRNLDLISAGELLAASRGVRVGLTTWGGFAAVGLLTAVIVANCGPIGFVGLMVPHFARAVLGARTLPVLLGSALIGAAFLALCDGLARAVIVYELPVGVVTNILGAGFFFYLLTRGDVMQQTVR